MRWLYILPLKLRSLFRRNQVEQDLDDELAFYLEQRTAHEISLGHTPEQAALIARRALDGIDRQKEACRDTRGTRHIENFFADLRFGVRNWRKTPGLWLLATLTIGLGIGANATMLSIVDKVWHRPLAQLNPATDVVIQSIRQNQPSQQNHSTLDDYLAWRAAPGFELITAHKAEEHVLTSHGDPERILGQAVSSGYFNLLGTELALGRFPTPLEHQAGANKVLVLSHEFWRNRFASNPKIVGDTIRLDGESYTVIGVATADHWFPSVEVKFWTPLIPVATPTSHKEGGVQILGRLKPGVTRQQAAATLASYNAELERRHPDTHTGARAEVKQLFDGFYSEQDRRVLVLLYLISAGVLMISCANVANLLMVRGLSRRREMAIRISLGAARGHILCQSITEGLLLALPALPFAVLAAEVSSSAILSQVRVPFPLDGSVMDPRFLALNLSIALGAVFLFSLFPALAATAIQGDNSARATLGPTTQRVTKSLVVLQVALGLALVMTAVLGARGLQIFFDLNPGYDRSQVLRAEFFPSHRALSSNSSIQQIHTRLLNQTGRSTQFQSVGLISLVPATNSGDGTRTRIATTSQILSTKDSPTADFIVASPGAMETLRIPLLRGRTITTSDTANSPRVTLINQKLADQLFAGRNPIGESIRVAELPGEPFEIIGIYANLQANDITSGPKPQFFVPFEQAPRRSMQWLGRMRDERTAVATLRAIAHDIDPLAPLQMKTLASAHDEGLDNGRALVYLLAAFAFLALFFGGCGLFAVVSQTVTQRLPEIGLRLALGASTSNIRSWVLASGFRLLAVGACLGTLAGLGLAGLLARQMVQVSPTDWQVILPSSLTFIAIGLAACAAPAWRAAKTDITRVIRQD
jgi:putative ABC transport system permease protein